MALRFVLSKGAEKDLRALDEVMAKQIIKKLFWFSKQSDPVQFAKQLREPTAGDFRFRIVDYRAIAVFHKKEKTIEIVKIGHRRNVYL